MQASYINALYTDFKLWIEKADNLDDLNSLIEQAAFSDNLTDAEYSALYEMAIDIARAW